MTNLIKKLTRWSEGLGIYFTKEEIELYGLRLNDTIDLSDFFLIQKKPKYKHLPKSKNLKEDIKNEVKKWKDI